MDVPADFKSGGEVLISQRYWMLRPGQMIEVLLGGEEAKPGLFVPPGAIRPTDAKRGRVFLLVDGKAREAAVRIGGSVGESIRIEPEDAAAAALVKPGSQLILDYIHFLENGEPVRMIREEELKP
jgi:hypothetical protein